MAMVGNATMGMEAAELTVSTAAAVAEGVVAEEIMREDPLMVTLPEMDLIIWATWAPR